MKKLTKVVFLLGFISCASFADCFVVTGGNKLPFDGKINGRPVKASSLRTVDSTYHNNALQESFKGMIRRCSDDEACKELGTYISCD